MGELPEGNVEPEREQMPAWVGALVALLFFLPACETAFEAFVSDSLWKALQTVGQLFLAYGAYVFVSQLPRSRSALMSQMRLRIGSVFGLLALILISVTAIVALFIGITGALGW